MARVLTRAARQDQLDPAHSRYERIVYQDRLQTKFESAFSGMAEIGRPSGDPVSAYNHPAHPAGLCIHNREACSQQFSSRHNDIERFNMTTQDIIYLITTAI
jgi:hypothetical protein